MNYAPTVQQVGAVENLAFTLSYQVRSSFVSFVHNDICSGRFKKKLRKYFNFDEKRCQEEWDAALRDSKIQKGKDVFGFQTVAKLWTNMTEQGRTVGHTKRVQDRKELPAETAEDMLAIGASVLT